MRDILTIIASIVILLLTAALAGPYFVDWSSHRAAIEARLSDALGTRVEITGSIDIKLLPTPRLELRQFAVGDAAVRLAADSARFELGVTPLLRGEYQILGAAFGIPRLSLQLDSNGAVSLPAVAAGKGGKVQIDRLDVRDGTILLIDPAGQRSTEISGISFEGSADALFGPVKGQGTFRRNGALITYRFSTGAAEANRLRVKLALDLAGYFRHAEFDGALVAKLSDGRRPVSFEGMASFNGRVATGQDPGIPWRVTATGNADAQRLHASNIEARLGDEDIAVMATGEADATFGPSLAASTARIDLSSRQVDLDRFMSKFDLGALLHVGNDPGVTPVLPTAIDWHGETITLGGDTASDANAGLRFSLDKPLAVTASASLPGRSRISMDGKFERGPAAGFEGRLEFACRDPERLANWVRPAAPNFAAQLQASPFAAIEIAGRAGLSAAGFVLRDLNAKLDRSSFGGTLSYTRALGTERARLFVDLASPALDLEKIPNLSALVDGAAATDISATLDAKAVKVGFNNNTVDAGRIRAKFARDAKETRLENLSIANLGGASVEARGLWRDGMAEIEAKLDAARLGDLVALAARLAPNRAVTLLQSRAASLSPAHLTLRGESAPGRPGPFDFSGLTIDGTLGATRTMLRIAPADDLGLSEANLVLEAPEAAALGRQLGLTVLPLRGVGKGRIAATARGRVGAPWTGRLDAAFAGTTIGLDGTLRLDGMLDDTADRPSLSGRLKVSSGDASPLLQVLAFSLPDMSARLPLDFGAELVWAPSSWRLEGLAGTINSAAISGGLARPSGATAIQGALSLDRLHLAALLRPVLGHEQPVRAGAVWSDRPFAPAAAEPPPLDLDLKAARLDLSEALSGSAASLHVALAPGALGIDRFSMQLAGGRLEGNLALRREDENVSLAGRLAFGHLAIERPAFAASITGGLEFASGGKSQAAIMAGLAGSGEIGLANVRVNGMDPQALQRVLALSEEEKIGVEAKDIDAALGRELDRAPFRSAGETMFDAALANGVLRLSPRNTVSDGATRTSYQAAFDTRRLGLDLQADISQPSVPRGWNAPTPQIGVSMSGLLAAPARRIESGAFVASLGARAVQREADHIEALEFDIKERAFFNRRLKWERARQEERERAAAEEVRAEQERILQERRAAEAAEAARRRAESSPAPSIIPPFANAPPVLRARPAVPMPPIAPYFRAPTANQDPSAAGRY